jgi:hypothetical protein
VANVSIIELTKDKEFRRTQLENFRRFFKEQEKELCDVVYKDLRKHPLETITGEIGPVCGDIEYMLKVKLDTFNFF